MREDGEAMVHSNAALRSELREFGPGVSTAQKQMVGKTQAEAGCGQNESDTCDPRS